MSFESRANLGATSWLGRLWQNYVLFGEAIELSDAERLERRVAALEVAAAKPAGPAEQI